MKKQWWFTGMAALLLVGCLTGCGAKPSKETAASQTSQAAAGDTGTKDKAADNTAGSDAGKGAARDENMKKMLEKQGVSPAEADELEKLIQSNHVQPKWISDQLKAGAKAADLISQIKAGKAPVRDNSAHDSNGQGKQDKVKDGGKQGASGGSKTNTQG